MINQRSFLLFVILNIITLGIYGIIFWYNYTDDLNQICSGDGKETHNYLIVILLSIVTCGIYYWVWLYGIGNRLNENAPRYHLNFTENGTTVLLWMILGSFLCFFGFYYAQYILVKNMNLLAERYNQTFYGNAQ